MSVCCTVAAGAGTDCIVEGPATDIAGGGNIRDDDELDVIAGGGNILDDDAPDPVEIAKPGGGTAGHAAGISAAFPPVWGPGRTSPSRAFESSPFTST